MLTESKILSSHKKAQVAWPVKHDLFGLQVSAVEYDEAVTCAINAAESGEPAVISCHAVHAVVTISGDKDLCEAANRFSMITPDGQPVRWALNSLYKTKLKDRVYGPEFMWRVLEVCNQKSLSVYLYGGTEESLLKLEENIKKNFSELQLVGSKSPPFRKMSEDELIETANEINELGAQIIFVGLGCPKQDQFVAAQADRIKGVQICVGAAFDFHAMLKPMAPLWMQRHGLEWLFRLSCEPKRLFRRYLITNTQFIYLYLKAYLFGVRSKTPND